MMWSPASASSSAFGAAAGAAAGAEEAAGIGSGIGAPASPYECTTCGPAGIPSIFTFVPACSTSTEAIPLSATLSISSRISLKFKSSALSNELVAQQVLRSGELESRAAVIAVGTHDE